MESSTILRKTAEERYLNYALSVITARALPDVRDGLKPVQRRILYAMFRDLGLAGGSRHRKSAAVVGEVLGKYHPHGDVAAYDAMVRMAQPFALRYPLVEGEGNFGSLDGDGAAAMRYTEARLAPIAEALLDDLRYDTVPFRDNYDATRTEPAVLPAGLPQLLMNGSTGIAVGMATNIPPHNLGEVLDALVALVDKPKATTKDLLRHVHGPDFPTGGEILNSKAELAGIYEKGQGTIRVRGEFHEEKLPRERRQVVITSVPYTVNKAALVEAIAERILSRRLPLVLDVRDESTEDVRIVLELKADADPELAMAYLYRHTELETGFHVNLTCLVPTANPLVGQPTRLSLRDLCRHFLDFRFEVVTRRLEYEKRRLQERLHVLEAFARIHGDLDEALRIIRGAESREDAAKKLRKAFRLDEVQVDAVLETRLYQLAKLEIGRIRKERQEKKKRLAEVERLLERPKPRWKLIREELLAAKKKYADSRRTRFAEVKELAYDPEAYVVEEEATVVLTRDGWVKRVRELKDRSTTRVREGDSVLRVLQGTTKDFLAVFSTFGTLYVLPVLDLPSTTGYGEPVQSMVRFADNERVLDAVLAPAEGRPVTDRKTQGELFSASRRKVPQFLVVSSRGFGFRFIPDLGPTTRVGRRFARLARGDELVSVGPVTGDEVVTAARRGNMLRFPLREVAELSGPGKGVYLMRPGEADDRIVGAVALPSDGRVVVDTVEGSERRLRSSEVPKGKRAGKGLRVVKRGRIASLRPDVAK